MVRFVGAAAAMERSARKRRQPSAPSLPADDAVIAHRRLLQEVSDGLTTLFARLPADPTLSEKVQTEDPPHITHGVSITQPFASAIVNRKLHIVNRSWAPRMPPNGSGVWLALQAKATLNYGRVRRTLERELKRTWPQMPPLSTLPMGAIIGLFHIKVRLL